MEQATSWADVKIAMDSVVKAVEKVPPPPQPRDSWSEKLNAFHKCVEGMREQLNSELEMEDMRNELGADGE
jgi:hypothetical protein